MIKETPNYYAIIPANVRYDKRLTPNAKLLYGEITALCNKDGFCWASNTYFAKLYDKTNKTISLWIKELIDCNYLNSKLIYKENSSKIANRYLSLNNDPINKNVHTPQQKCSYPPLKNVHTPPPKNVKDNNTSSNNTINTTSNKESDNKTLFELKVVMPILTEKFTKAWDEWKLYRKEQHKFTFKGLVSEKAALKKLRDLSNNDEKKAVLIIEQSIANTWKGFFELKNENKTKKKQYKNQTEDYSNEL